MFKTFENQIYALMLQWQLKVCWRRLSQSPYTSNNVYFNHTGYLHWSILFKEKTKENQVKATLGLVVILLPSFPSTGLGTEVTADFQDENCVRADRWVVVALVAVFFVVCALLADLMLKLSSTKAVTRRLTSSLNRTGVGADGSERTAD